MLNNVLGRNFIVGSDSAWISGGAARLKVNMVPRVMCFETHEFSELIDSSTGPGRLGRYFDEYWSTIPTGPLVEPSRAGHARRLSDVASLSWAALYKLMRESDRVTRDYVKAVPGQLEPEGETAMDPWDAKNERRIQLIEKDCAKRLKKSERTELAQLEEEFGERLQRLHPKPLKELEEFERRVELLTAKLVAERGPKP